MLPTEVTKDKVRVTKENIHQITPKHEVWVYNNNAALIAYGNYVGHNFGYSARGLTIELSGSSVKYHFDEYLVYARLSGSSKFAGLPEESTPSANYVQAAPGSERRFLTEEQVRNLKPGTPLEIHGSESFPNKRYTGFFLGVAEMEGGVTGFHFDATGGEAVGEFVLYVKDEYPGGWRVLLDESHLENVDHPAKPMFHGVPMNEWLPTDGVLPDVEYLWLNSYDEPRFPSAEEDGKCLIDCWCQILGGRIKYLGYDDRPVNRSWSSNYYIITPELAAKEPPDWWKEQRIQDARTERTVTPEEGQQLAAEALTPQECFGGTTTTDGNPYARFMGWVPTDGLKEEDVPDGWYQYTDDIEDLGRNIHVTYIEDGELLCNEGVEIDAWMYIRHASAHPMWPKTTVKFVAACDPAQDPVKVQIARVAEVETVKQQVFDAAMEGTTATQEYVRVLAKKMAEMITDLEACPLKQLLEETCSQLRLWLAPEISKQDKDILKAVCDAHRAASFTTRPTLHPTPHKNFLGETGMLIDDGPYTPKPVPEDGHLDTAPNRHTVTPGVPHPIEVATDEPAPLKFYSLMIHRVQGGGSLYGGSVDVSLAGIDNYCYRFKSPQNKYHYLYRNDHDASTLMAIIEDMVRRGGNDPILYLMAHIEQLLLDIPNTVNGALQFANLTETLNHTLGIAVAKRLRPQSINRESYGAESVRNTPEVPDNYATVTD